MSSELHVSITPRGMSIQEAYRLFRDNALLVNRRYQRKLVWSVSEKQLLIGSILHGYPIPLILLAERPEIHGSGKYEIIDGMQRLDAIFSFIEQRFDFQGEYFDLSQSARARQAADSGAFEEVDDELWLTAEKCANLLDYQLAVTIFPTQTEEQITDVFSRINSNGRQLSVQEKRQAGRLNPFSDLVRSIASSLRGDVSDDILLLHDMPSISVDSSRERQQYGVRAEDTVWIRHGIINVKQLREGEDEQMVADIMASVLLGQPLAASKEEFDELYDSDSEKHKDIEKRLAAYGASRLKEEILSTFSVLTEVVDSEVKGTNGLRNIVRSGGGNPIKTPFYAIFMAFFELIVKQQRSPIDSAAIVNSIDDVGPKLKSARHYTSSEDRISNIDIITGLVQRYFVEQVPPVFGHGPSLSLDFENSLRRSKIETSRYEFKQGVLRLDSGRAWDEDLFPRLAQTICGIANVKKGQDGYLFIGVADRGSHVKRIESLDSISSVEAGVHSVVGIDREAAVLGFTIEEYVQKFISSLSRQEIEKGLMAQILRGVDTVEYKGFSVIRLLIPGQDSISYLGDELYVRENSSTKLISGAREIAGAIKSFG